VTTIRNLISALAAALFLAGVHPASAQGTAFTYQGQLLQNGSPAIGTNDLLFTLYATNGSTLGSPITNPAVGFTNGLFTVTLNFGANVISNTPCLLGIGVRPAGSTNAFTALSPLQPVTPAPQAIFAGTAAGVVNGAISAASLSPGVGTDGKVLKMNGGALTWGADLNSGGTISNLATGLGLVGGPVTYTGTLAIDPAVVPQLAATNTFTSGQVIQNGNAANPALAITGASGQTADLQDWRNNSGTVLASVNSGGVISGNGSGLTALNGVAITPGTAPATAIGTNQVVKNLNGLMDYVVVAPGNNMILATNGNTLTFNTAPGLLSWFVASGSSSNAQPNKGYLFTNAAQAVLTLPASPALGDIIRISGVSSNGWIVAQNAGQSVFIQNLPGNIGATWVPHDSNRNWDALAASIDGSKLVAAVTGGQLYTSIDSGTNWTAHGVVSNWVAVASSADGTVLVAAVNGGQLYTSADSGFSWTPRSIKTNWVSVACSADASVMVAASFNTLNYVSTDFGVTWTPYAGATGGRLAISADGMKVADASLGGTFYASTNGGLTWNATTNTLVLSALAASADGSKLVGTVNGGKIYTSINYGAIWTAHDTNRAWSAVASSADGTKLVAAVTGGQIYTSLDSGSTWFAHATNRAWSALAASADGTKLVAGVNGGQIYTSVPLGAVTSTGTNGFLLGQPYSAVELQYIGNNQFMPLSHEGFVTGN
jgi:hypothetical protein